MAWGDLPVNVSTRMVKYWWRQINQILFNGVLPPLRNVRIVNHRREYAWAVPSYGKQVRITIQPRFITKRVFFTVLVHEMVHAWEHYRGFRMAHGQRFLKWGARVDRLFALPLSEYV